MVMTLVGVFDSIAEAQEACGKLQALGIDKRSVRMTTGESAPVVADSQLAGVEQGMHAARKFFAALFGQDGGAGTRAGHYSEAVRRGSAVLTVGVKDDGQADTVAELLENCGAIDIDERIEQWRATGYRGHDAQADGVAAKQGGAQRAAMTPMAAHLREDAMGPDLRGAGARSIYRGPERRRQPGSSPYGLERRAGS